MRALHVGLLLIALTTMTTMTTMTGDAQVPVMTDSGWSLPTRDDTHAQSAEYSAGGYEAAIYDACSRYGCDGDWLISVAYCESGMDPNAVGVHGEIGLFQFMDYTFYAYGGSDIWNPYDQIEVAARMFSEGLSYHWVCA